MTQRTEQQRNWGRVHKWLAHHYGKADHCEFCGKTEGKFNWAKKSDREYEKNVDNFLQLCVSCHRKYDCTEDIRKARSKAFKGRLMSPNILTPVVQFKDGVPIGSYQSVTEAAKANGIKRQGISMCLIKKHKSAGGFQWDYAN